MSNRRCIGENESLIGLQRLFATISALPNSLKGWVHFILKSSDTYLEITSVKDSMSQLSISLK